MISQLGLNATNWNVKPKLAWLAPLALVATLITPFIFSANASAKSKSYVCNHPDAPGGWGALDLGCDADQFGDLSRVRAIYPMFVFDRRSPGIEPTKEYLTNMNAVIRKVAKDYYLKRIPKASPAVLEGWMRAAVAIGAHESRLSHFRISQDGRYKLMTGDHLISHGVMQVNQEFQANKALDSSFDLVGNIVGGLDTYFIEWNRAIKEQCIVSSNAKGSLGFGLSNRARGAYSAYNGGPGKLCRFLDAKNVYKAHDKQFLEMYRDQPWMKYVTEPNRKSPVNTQCLINGDDLCAMAKPARAKYVTSRPLVLPDGRTCVTNDAVNFTCATDMRLFTCLAKIDPEMLENDPLKLAHLPEAAKITTVSDREGLCQHAVSGLFKVGTMIVLQKEILMREEIGESPIGNTRAGRTYQVLDYDLRLGGKSDRYYKIKTTGGDEGWIYGGTNADRAAWIKVAPLQSVVSAAKPKLAVVPEVTSPSLPLRVTVHPLPKGSAAAEKNDDDDAVCPVLPIVGSVIEITKYDGIVLRSVAGEPEDIPFLDQLVQGARLTVEAVKTMGTDNRLYLKVTQNGKTGWIYVGRTFPDVTTSKWIKLWK